MAAEAMATVAIPAAARLSLMTYPFRRCFYFLDKLSFIRASSGAVCHWVACRLHCPGYDAPRRVPVTSRAQVGTAGRGARVRNVWEAIGSRAGVPGCAKTSPILRVISYAQSVTVKWHADSRVMPGADVDPRARLGPGASVWHLAQIREDAEIGADCVIGRGAYIGPEVRLGQRCKVQNYALIYEPAWLDDGVFVGPGVVFTNDRYPRAVTPDGSIKTAGDWEPVSVTVRYGASIGASAVCVAPVTVGRRGGGAARSVVLADVPDFALVAGTPARFVRWVGRAGVPLVATDDGQFRCPQTGAGSGLLT